MPYLRIANVRVNVTEPESQLPRRVAQRLGLSEADVARWRIVRKSLDARSRRALKFVYTVLVELPEGDLLKVAGRGKRPRWMFRSATVRRS